VVVAESITLKSLNGPAVTIIKGYQVPERPTVLLPFAAFTCPMTRHSPDLR